MILWMAWQIEIHMGDYKVGLCVRIQAGLQHSAGSQGLLGFDFLLSLWLYLTELEEGGEGWDEHNWEDKKKKDKTYPISPLI